MRWSMKLIRVAGIEVRIHLTFLLLLGWIAFTYYRIGGVTAAVEGLILILALFLCVLLHEFGHAFAAKRFGIDTPDITLLPIGGVARLQRMPDKPWQELVVALAGPAVNVVIAGVLILFLAPRMDLGDRQNLERPSVALLAKLAEWNVTLVLFNLVPAFPMDGGRILRALLAMTMNAARATQIAAWIGQALAFVFALIGLFGNPLLLFIALFVYLGASQEASMAQMKDVSAGLPVSAAMVTQFERLRPEATLDEAVQMLLRTSQHEFPVVDEQDHPLGVLTRDDLVAALKRGEPNSPVRQFMRVNLPIVSPQDPFDKAFQKMQECGCPALPVVDRFGRLIGLITPENVGEMMMVHSLRSRDRSGWRK
jgi:Zn-dependent protease/CBS domain-containing protein